MKYHYIPKDFTDKDILSYSNKGAFITIVDIIYGSVESNECSILDIYGDYLYNFDKMRVLLNNANLFEKRLIRNFFE